MTEFDSARAVIVLRVLANAPRLAVLRRLLDGEVGVAELESGLGIRQPGLSQHLGELREAGLVSARREARSVFYRIADADALRLVSAVLSSFGATLPVSAPVPPTPSGPVPAAERPYGVARFARVLS